MATGNVHTNLHRFQSSEQLSCAHVAKLRRVCKAWTALIDFLAGDDLAEQLAVVLLQLLCEEQQGEQRGGQQGGQSLHPFLLGLRRLATDWPPLLLPYIPLLGSCITTAGYLALKPTNPLLFPASSPPHLPPLPYKTACFLPSSPPSPSKMLARWL